MARQPELKRAAARARALGALTELPGVGPARQARLARLGLEDLYDLLTFMPRELERWQAPLSIAEARERKGERVRVSGALAKLRLTRLPGRRSLVRATLEDDSAEIDALFFNQPWMREQLAEEETLTFEGRVVDAKGPALATPKVGTLTKPLPEPGHLTPLYRQTEGVGQEFLARLCREVVARHASDLEELIPEATRARLELPHLADAVREAHAPRSEASFTMARRRLALEPLLELQARIAARSANRGSGKARPVSLGLEERAELLAHLPFELTGAQKRITDELAEDLAKPVPMRRLLQGDVGSGKTVLAVFAAMAVARAGGQVAIMAPTELLAEQHYHGLKSLLRQAGFRPALLTGSASGAKRAKLLERIGSGATEIVFGTHALFSTDVRYARLDLCVIDEQHRFGVGQRAALSEKGSDVHTLLLTATPIPRTLALTVYGDIDVSVLDEAPPGRGRVTTRWVRGPKREEIVPFLATRLAAGERVYWVCPRIGDEDRVLGSAIARHEKLNRGELAAFGVELVHGRLDGATRARRLEQFRRGDTQVVVATTVIEVGIDVPEATVIVIEEAERLGLAQLHQLRGRVGRSERESWCLLCGAKAAEPRFRVLERTRDGFEIAEEDLVQRGMGDLAGVRQSGVNAEGLEDAWLDPGLLLAARDLVRTSSEVREHYLGAASR